MTFTLASSTDTQDEVNVAAGIKPEEKISEVKSGDEKSKTGADSETVPPVDEKKDESKSAAESGTAEVEDEQEEEEEVEEEEKPEAKKKGGFSKRIDRLTREKSELAEQLAHVQGQLAEKNAAKSEDRKAAAVDPEPQAKDFEKHEDYIAAIARWNTRQETSKIREQERQAAFQQRTQETFDSYNQAANDFRKEHDDFDEVVGSPDIKIPAAVQVAIVEMGNDGPELAYFLGQHPEECEKLLEMSDARAVAYLGRIDATLHPDEKENPPAKKIPVSKAAEPAKLVKTSATTSAKSPDEMTHKEYRAWRDKQSAGRFRS